MNGARLCRYAFYVAIALVSAAWAQTPQKPAPVAKSATGKPAPAPPLMPEFPDWLFPIDPTSIRPPKDPPKLDDVEPLSVPDGEVTYTLARINDPFNAPDWRPGKHGPLPEVVAKGRKPDVMACAFCHSPTGQGRPENAALAGLPEAYIRRQLLDFRSGARKPLGPEKWLPDRDMHKTAKSLTDAEIDECAKWFSQQKLARRVWVVESLRIPRAEPAAWTYGEVNGTEDLDDRLIELTNELERHERRDDRLEYTVHVPPGALVDGKLLVTKGGAKTQVCATCHLQNLRGTDLIPPISGRSPSYLLRQLIAFKNGARANAEAAQMKPVVEKLEIADMIAIAGYVGSLYP